MFHVPEKYRSTEQAFSDESYGNNGQFKVSTRATYVKGAYLWVQASDGLGWEHCSITVYKQPRAPTWNQMCIIKDLFWDDEDCVVQYHPPKSEYINTHQYCLHLWRQVNTEFPFPDKLLVG